MLRIVVDTNIMVSAAMNARGAPRSVIDAMRNGSIEAVLTDALQAELDDVLSRRAVRLRIPLSDQELEALTMTYIALAKRAEPSQTITRITADPADNRVLEAAVAGAADYIVSGDAHLLALGEHDGIPIVTPARFLEILTAL